jgi:hypothetical protein
MTKLKVNDVIEINGFVMLNKMEGRLKVALIEKDKIGRDVAYWFSKPKGKKHIVGHTIPDIDMWVENGSEINNIKIIN